MIKGGQLTLEEARLLLVILQVLVVQSDGCSAAHIEAQDKVKIAARYSRCVRVSDDAWMTHAGAGACGCGF